LVLKLVLVTVPEQVLELELAPALVWEWTWHNW
jgi:hypothetical protein